MVGRKLNAWAPVKSCFEDLLLLCKFSSVQFSPWVVFDSLWTHELQDTRPPCPSPIPRVHSNSCPSSWWCHPAISSSVISFSSCPQSLPASESFPMSQLTLCMRWPKYWSFSFSIIPSKEHPGLISFRMDWLDLLAVHGILKSLLQQYSFYRLPNNRIQVPCLIDKAVDMPELCSFDLRL